jgi:hypothetical protein
MVDFAGFAGKIDAEAPRPGREREGDRRSRRN